MFQSHFGAGELEIMHPTTTQKDTTYTKIFVGGLPYHTTDASLRKHFAAFGDIDEAAVITDRQTGKSRGYGFVTMMDRRGADRACKDPSPIIDGRKANVNLAYLGAKPRSPPTGLSGYSVGMQQIHPALLQRQYGLAQQYLHPQTFLHPGLLLQSQLGPASSSSSSLGSSPYLDYASAYAHYAAGLENYYHQHHLLATSTPSSAGYLGYSLSPSAPPTPPAVATPLASGAVATAAPQASLLRYPLLHQPDRLH